VRHVRSLGEVPLAAVQEEAYMPPLVARDEIPVGLGVGAPSSAEDAPSSSSAMGAPSSDTPGLKLIFLDIDGVICCNGIGRLEPDKLARIAEVVKQTDAKVVLSTDWRRDAALKAQVTNALTDRGIQVIGATRKGPPMQPIRPKEIYGWLEAYQNEKQKVVAEWCAIDDRELLSEQGGEKLRGHFVLTNFATGLTDRAAERVIAVLNGNHDEGMGAMKTSMVRANSPVRGGRRTPSPTRSGPQRTGPTPTAEAKGGFTAALASTSPGGLGASSAPSSLSGLGAGVQGMMRPPAGSRGGSPSRLAPSAQTKWSSSMGATAPAANGGSRAGGGVMGGSAPPGSPTPPHGRLAAYGGKAGLVSPTTKARRKPKGSAPGGG